MELGKSPPAIVMIGLHKCLYVLWLRYGGKLLSQLYYSSGLTGCAAQNIAQSILRSLALLPVQKNFAQLFLYRQHSRITYVSHFTIYCAPKKNARQQCPRRVMGSTAEGWLHCDLGHHIAAVPNTRFGHLVMGRFRGVNVVASVVPLLSLVILLKLTVVVHPCCCC